jgi:deoxyribodipyrimidine photolyase-like uncharacterized protein
LELYDKNEDKLGKNPRIGMMYNVWRKMKPSTNSLTRTNRLLFEKLMNYKTGELLVLFYKINYDY